MAVLFCDKGGFPLKLIKPKLQTSFTCCYQTIHKFFKGLIKLGMLEESQNVGMTQQSLFWVLTYKI